VLDVDHESVLETIWQETSYVIEYLSENKDSPQWDGRGKIPLSFLVVTYY